MKIENNKKLVSLFPTETSENRKHIEKENACSNQMALYISLLCFLTLYDYLVSFLVDLRLY